MGKKKYYNMVIGTSEKFSEIANLLGDKCRSNMLWNLLDGRAYTATELSLCAEISPQAASNHLSKLVEAQILSVEKQGRHRYYTFAHAGIAYAIESMANLMPIGNLTHSTKESHNKIELARTCYDHLAGKLGVAITHSLIDNNLINQESNQYILTDAGKNWFRSINIEVETIGKGKRVFARPCLDWSERKHHLAGALGAALLQTIIHNDWIRKKLNSREVILTAKGRLELEKRLGLIF
jgi:DNA-binding transcriptional ArsR family regulator